MGLDMGLSQNPIQAERNTQTKLLLISNNNQIHNREWIISDNNLKISPSHLDINRRKCNFVLRKFVSTTTTSFNVCLPAFDTGAAQI